jgi:hypothetical protein
LIVIGAAVSSIRENALSGTCDAPEKAADEAAAPPNALADEAEPPAAVADVAAAAFVGPLERAVDEVPPETTPLAPVADAAAGRTYRSRSA